MRLEACGTSWLERFRILVKHLIATAICYKPWRHYLGHTHIHLSVSFQSYRQPYRISVTFSGNNVSATILRKIETVRITDLPRATFEDVSRYTVVCHSNYTHLVPGSWNPRNLSRVGLLARNNAVGLF